MVCFACVYFAVMKSLIYVSVGVSMGGAIAIHTARRNRLTSLSGLIVIDVVEGRIKNYCY